MQWGTERSMSAEKRLDLAGRRVLIADDELLCAMVLEEEVQEMGGHVVGPVSRVGDIVETAKQGNADIAVLDVNMMGQLSYAAAMELLTAGVPVIFMSGYDRLMNAPEALRQLPLIMKPWTSDKLGEALTWALAQKSA